MFSPREKRWREHRDSIPEKNAIPRSNSLFGVYWKDEVALFGRMQRDPSKISALLAILFWRQRASANSSIRLKTVAEHSF